MTPVSLLPSQHGMGLRSRFSLSIGGIHGSTVRFQAMCYVGDCNCDDQGIVLQQRAGLAECFPAHVQPRLRTGLACSLRPIRFSFWPDAHAIVELIVVRIPLDWAKEDGAEVLVVCQLRVPLRTKADGEAHSARVCQDFRRELPRTRPLGHLLAILQNPFVFRGRTCRGGTCSLRFFRQFGLEYLHVFLCLRPVVGCHGPWFHHVPANFAFLSRSKVKVSVLLNSGNPQ